MKRNIFSEEQIISIFGLLPFGGHKGRLARTENSMLSESSRPVHSKFRLNSKR